MTGTQLSLFAPVERVQFMAPPAEQAGGARQQLAGGYSVAAAGEYWQVYLAGEWLGSIRFLGGSTWCLYFPGARGVCGFGGPGKPGAAAELHRCYKARAAGKDY
jgi:hypothetical protein